MPLPTGLRERQGVWQLRIGVPADLRHLYPGIDAYRGSLRTRDRSEAITKAHALLAEYRTKFDQQRASEAVRRAPPCVPFTPEIERYLVEHSRWLPLLLDDVVRFTPGLMGAMTPGIRYLTSEDPTPLILGDDPKRWNRLLQLLLEQARADLGAGRLERVQQAADLALQNLGVRVDWSDPKARMGLIQIARAQVRAHQQSVERGQGEPHDTPAPPIAPIGPIIQPKPKAEPAPTLRDMVPDWITRTKARSNAKQRTNTALGLWEKAVGIVPLGQITRATGATFVAFLLDEGRPFGSKTAANHAAAINALMNTAVKVGKVERNPLDLSFKITDTKEREQWTLEELQTIFESPLFGNSPGPQPLDVDSNDARLWLWSLLWSGTRAGEIAQLRVEDVQQRDGVLCLYLTPEAGTIKDQSSRWLPVAEAVRPLLQTHLEARKTARDTALFPSFHRRPGTTPADLATRWFRAFRDAYGLPPGALNGSHRFRHTVRTRLAELGVSPDLADQVTGHSATGSTGRRVYTGTIRPAFLAETVEQLGWPWPKRP